MPPQAGTKIASALGTVRVGRATKIEIAIAAPHTTTTAILMKATGGGMIMTGRMALPPTRSVRAMAPAVTNANVGRPVVVTKKAHPEASSPMMRRPMALGQATAARAIVEAAETGGTARVTRWRVGSVTATPSAAATGMRFAANTAGAARAGTNVPMIASEKTSMID